MKNIFKYKFPILVAVLFMTATSCNDGLTDLNVDPNNPVEVPAVNLVSQAQWALHNRLWSRGYNAEWSMLMVQHWAQNEYAEESRYTVDGNDFDIEWLDIYAGTGTSSGGVLINLETAASTIEEDASVNAKTKANQLAIIKVLKAHAYHNLTDAYGDIPFSQALNSVEYSLPAYDSQETVYGEILKMLDEAATAMDASAGSFGSGDLIFGGDVAAWKRTAYSLMMRVAMRMVDVDQATATEFIQKAAGNMITSNSENAMFVFSDNPSLANPLYVDASINNRDDFAVTKFLVDNLTDMGDPRLQVFADTNNVGNIVGMPYGLTDGEAFALKSTTSRPSTRVRSAQDPAIIIDYAEVMFMAAEAFQRGILTGDAAEAYAEGVKASMNYWGIDDDAAIADYVAANPYDASNWKKSIGWQKWIAFYMNGPQAWAEWRRLDFPQLAVPVAATNPSIPVRLPYPISEQTRNATSLGVVTQSPDDLNAKLWWDVN